MGAHLECLGDILGSFGASEGRGSDFWGAPDAHLGSFQGSLGSTFELPGWFGCHFWDSWVTFVKNVASCKTYGKP